MLFVTALSCHQISFLESQIGAIKESAPLDPGSVAEIAPQAFIFSSLALGRCHRISIMALINQNPSGIIHPGWTAVLMEEMERQGDAGRWAPKWRRTRGIRRTLGLPGKIKFTRSQFTSAQCVISQWGGLSVSVLTAARATKCAEISGRHSASCDSL